MCIYGRLVFIESGSKASATPHYYLVLSDDLEAVTGKAH